MLGNDEIAFFNAEDLTEQQVVNTSGQPDSDWKRLAIEADEVLLSGGKCKISVMGLRQDLMIVHTAILPNLPISSGLQSALTIVAT